MVPNRTTHDICPYLGYSDTLFVLGDLNGKTSEKCLDDFCKLVNLSDIMKKITCFKNPNNSSCIDLFFTNRASCRSFQNRTTFFSPIFIKWLLLLWKYTIKRKNKKRSYKGAAKRFQKIHLTKNWIMMKSLKINKQFWIFRF